MSELSKLRKKARRLYQETNDFSDLSCGRNLAEYIRPHIGVTRQEFNEVWEQIEKLDPSAPSNPLK